MPRGVEHDDCAMSASDLFDVRVPVMPRGVEHLGFDYSQVPEMQVRVPVMPRGVEHEVIWRAPAGNVVCESTCDAARR